MTLDERVALIDAMIKENPDYTIKDYMELVKDIDTIEIKTRAIEATELFMPTKQQVYQFTLLRHWPLGRA
jgi:hypothetical protein